VNHTFPLLRHENMWARKTSRDTFRILRIYNS
jgi:hypothetical protein